MPKATVKNVKTFRGMEGGGYEATIYVDDVKVGTVLEEGRGGEPIFRFVAGGETTWDNYLASLPRTPKDKREREIRSLFGAGENAEPRIQELLAAIPAEGEAQKGDMVIARLVDRFELRRRLARDISKKGLFYVEDDDLTKGLRTIAACNPATRAAMANKYAPRKIIWVNDDLDAAVLAIYEAELAKEAARDAKPYVPSR